MEQAEHTKYSKFIVVETSATTTITSLVSCMISYVDSAVFKPKITTSVHNNLRL